MGPETASGQGGDERGAQHTGRAAPAPVGEVRLASAVMFVQDLDSSVRFYRELLNMEVPLRRDSAALLVSASGFQLYLRSMGPAARHALGGAGVQYVIWTPPDPEDLLRCERLLQDAGVHVQTQVADGFTLVEGRDPSGVPVVLTYPGPDQVARQEIMSRIYAW